MSYINSSFCASEVVKLLMLVILFGGDLIQAEGLHFSYPTFNTSDRKDLIFSKDTDIYLNAIQVTRDVRGADISNFTGRVLYGQKFKLWSRKKNTTASFNSTFVLNITPVTHPGAEGLTFLLTDNSILPENSQGQWLGLVNSSTNGSLLTKTVAVEFDTRKSYSEDLDGDHVGVDLNSINSIQQVALLGHGVNISSGLDVNVTIKYDGVLKKLNISMFMTGNVTGEITEDPIISMDLNLTDYLPEDVYIGFSASTGVYTQLNCVKSWYFTSTDIQEDSDNLLWVWILVSLIISIILLCGFTYYKWRKSGHMRVQEQEQEPEQEKYPGIEQEIQISTTSPQKYQLTELVYATDGFHPKYKLGEGGFGTVYKGLLYNKEVAVKRISKDSRQGKQEFLAEVQTISGLHHKNLVKLKGWCYESNELLLVYEFMPNGSLDKLIYFDEKASLEISSTLSWEKRHSIIHGVGQALDYLHNGCEKRVLHRDIKASNIMLDSEFNARLGDFGLARTIRLSERTHHSTKEIAGTPGYIAPEFFHTGRASAEIDVYAFGILLLEVACGKKPANFIEQNHYINGIVEWVWELYRRERIVDAIDERLNGEFESDQAECVLLLGLACCHPNPYERPSMRSVLQVLTGEVDPPNLPIDKPAFMWPAMAPPSFSLYDLSLSGGQITPFSELSGR